MIAIEVEDRRPLPSRSRWRSGCCATRRSTSAAQLETFARDHMVTVRDAQSHGGLAAQVRGDRIVLTQEFREGDYCCKSAVAVAIVGRTRRRATS